MESQKNETIEYQLYKLDQQYKSDTNLIGYIDEAQNFYNGNQYPNANYNNMVRVTFNICSFSAQIKASKICGTPIYLAYTADNPDVDCSALRRFDEYNCNKLNIKSHNYQAALNGFVNGTEVTFIRWDDDDTTYKGIYKGGLSEEHIDLRNLAVANPYIQDIQNQEWVEYWEDYPVRAIKELVEAPNEEEKEAKINAIEREGANEDEYKNKDAINHALCRVFTRFFRVDGEVYFMCSTNKVQLFEYPHSLSRKVNKEKIKKVVEEYKKTMEQKIAFDGNGNVIQDYKIDPEDIIMSASSTNVLTDTGYKEIKEKFSLYPFAVYRPFSQNRSFYGRSDIKQLIPIQKGLNFALSMNLKCAENNAYNKILAKPEALQNQTITNEPSQVLFDYSGFTNGWGIKFAESQPMPNGLLGFTKELLGMTRVVYGFNDVMDGSISNQDMSGYMLQQMIKQSNSALEQQQQLFWAYNQDKAAIRLMYYKHYVDSAKYTYELDDAVYESEEQARQKMYNYLNAGNKLASNPNATKEDFATPTHKTKVLTFENKDIWGTNFDISIEAMQGLQDSKLIEQQMWDNLFMNGNIQNIEPEYLEAYFSSPNVSPRTRTAVKNIIEKRKQSKIAELENELQRVTQYCQTLIQHTKQQEKQLGTQGQYLKNLENEFSSKINSQNTIIKGLNGELSKYMKPSEGEVKSNNSRGIDGTTFQ